MADVGGIFKSKKACTTASVLDGRSAGRTDDAGALLVSAAERPERIAVTWRGQRLEGAFDEVLLSRRPSLRIALLE
ncbi:MAG: hypothetical protein AAFZ87_18795 [Planctomycetota bacterium]